MFFSWGNQNPGKRIRMNPLGKHQYHPGSPIKRVTLLGTNIEVEWELNTSVFYLTMPEVEINDIATVFRFELM